MHPTAVLDEVRWCSDSIAETLIGNQITTLLILRKKDKQLSKIFFAFRELFTYPLHFRVPKPQMIVAGCTAEQLERSSQAVFSQDRSFLCRHRISVSPIISPWMIVTPPSILAALFTVVRHSCKLGLDKTTYQTPRKQLISYRVRDRDWGHPVLPRRNWILAVC